MKATCASHWAGSFLLLSVSFAGSKCLAHDVTVTGVVKTESGHLVTGGTLIVYEYVAKLASMPDVKIRAVRVTDKDGAFEISLKGVHGDLEIQVVRDRCEWKDESVRLPIAELEGRAKHELNIVPRDDHCRE